MKTWLKALLPLFFAPLAWALDTHQLPMNSEASHPPLAHVGGYAVPFTELAKNGNFADSTNGWTSEKSDLQTVAGILRKDGLALQVPSTAIQVLPHGALIPGRAYALLVDVRTAAGGRGMVGVRFREPLKSTTFRTYKLMIPAGETGQYRIDFTAPAYTDMAEIVLMSIGSAMTVDYVSLKARTPIPVTEPVASWDQSFTPPGYALVFNDEFNGPELNRSKWFTRYIYGGELSDKLNDEQQRYADNNNNHVLEQGVLKLTARRNAASLPTGVNYESGMIRSDWTMRYGFLEARVKMPGGRGVWTAFWLNSDVGETGRLNWPPEIDVFEFVNNVENDKVNKIHLAANTAKGTKPEFLYSDPGFRPWFQDWYAPFDFDKGWHTVGLEWKTDRISFYVDGLEVMTRSHSWTYGDGVLGAPAHILLNFAVGGAWAGRHGIDDAAFPQSFDIDWVRAYRKVD